MDNTSTAVPGAAAAAGAPPPPAPAPAAPPPAAPPVAPPVPPMNTGGMTPPGSGGIKGFFNGVTIADVIFFGIASTALFLSIYYYKMQIINAKTWKSQERNDIDEVKSNLQALMGANYKTF